jgi:hypothetical protein
MRVQDAHSPAQFDAIKIRQPGVQQKKVEVFGLDQRQGLGRSPDGSGFDEGELQQLAQHFTSVFIILYAENSGLGVG